MMTKEVKSKALIPTRLHVLQGLELKNMIIPLSLLLQVYAQQQITYSQQEQGTYSLHHCSWADWCHTEPHWCAV